MPSGVSPVEYDFGNGVWDYAETGSFIYTYPKPGTYKVTARRGASQVTANVTIPTA